MRGSGSGQFFIVSGVPTFAKRPLKIQMFGGQTFMFEPNLNLFSRYVSTVRSKRRYHSSRVYVDVAGRDNCRFCTMPVLNWCSEDLNKQFPSSQHRPIRRTSRSPDRFALRQLLWPDFSTSKSFDSSAKVIQSLHVISLAVRDRQWNKLPAKFKITWRHSNRPIRWRP